jgi:MIP family channel proteins
MAEEGESTPLLDHEAQDSGPSGAIGLLRKCASELVATALFVFIGTVSVATGNSLLIAIAHGLTITLLITAFGDISGGHINPVVTLGVWLGAGALPVLSVLLYIVSQLIGAVLGALLTKVVLTYDKVLGVNHTTTVYESIRGGSHTLAEGVGPVQAIVFETVLTFILVLTVLMVAVEKTSHRHLAPLSIGLAVLVDIAAACNVTGGSMNPARSFGPAAVIFNLDHSVLLEHHYVYWVGPVIGSLIAAALYRLIFAGPTRRIIGRE